MKKSLNLAKVLIPGIIFILMIMNTCSQPVGMEIDGVESKSYPTPQPTATMVPSFTHPYTDGAQSITETSAEISGHIDISWGEYPLRYDVSLTYWKAGDPANKTVAAEEVIESRQGTHSISAVLTGLEPNTVYEYEFFDSTWYYHQAQGGGSGGIKSFTTLPLSVSTWDANTVYVAGDQAYYAGKIWTAKWWTLGEVPTSSGQWGPWK